MQKRKGISLIVLVITIIVMIILAASVVITLSNTGIINRASQAVDLTNEKQVQDLAALIWAECYLDSDKKADLENSVKTELAKQGITTDKWNIIVTNTGVTVTSKLNAGGNTEPVELTTLSEKNWEGLTNLNGNNIWTDGANIYYSTSVADFDNLAGNGLPAIKYEHYILNGNVWEQKTWNGFTSFLAYNIWTDGANTYYSSGSDQYVLNGDTWEKKIWTGLTSFQGNSIWTDGTNTYYSGGSTHYVLNGDTWQSKKWNVNAWSNSTNISGMFIWTDGTNIYQTGGMAENYVLNGDTWEQKTWNGLNVIDADYVWTDGVNTYYSSGTSQYVLNGNTWEPKTWNGVTSFNGSYVWTDGTRYYLSNGSTQYVFS